MDLVLVMAELRPGENVAPDLSSYDAMVAKWRGSGDPPSLAECEAKWAEIAPTVGAPAPATLAERVQALEELLAEKGTVTAQELTAKRGEIRDAKGA